MRDPAGDWLDGKSKFISQTKNKSPEIEPNRIKNIM